VASRRRHDLGAHGGASDGEQRNPPLLPMSARAVPLAANDNRAPLLVRLQRLAILSLGGAALGWLFWVGLLR
jgi:hypothetical protein